MHGYLELLRPNSQKDDLRMFFTLRKGCGARRWTTLYCGLAALMVIGGASAVSVEAQETSIETFARSSRPTASSATVLMRVRVKQSFVLIPKEGFS